LRKKDMLVLVCNHIRLEYGPIKKDKGGEMMTKSAKEAIQSSVFSGALRIFSLILILLIALAGCATTSPNQQAIATERVLAAAGFQIRPADSPEKLAHLKTLPQRKLFTRKDKEGKVHYIYGDAVYCECMYVGTEKTYEMFRELARLKNVTVEQSYATGLREAPADESWDMWGMWRDHWAEP
jgi:hypothetical protein